jgi:hypothetical protein
MPAHRIPDAMIDGEVVALDEFTVRLPNSVLVSWRSACLIPATRIGYSPHGADTPHWGLEVTKRFEG